MVSGLMSQWIKWKLFSFVLYNRFKEDAATLLSIQAANGIHGFQIHSRGYARARVCVCAYLLCEWSRVYNKWQMVYKDALRSLTHILSSMLTSHCVVKLYPWHVFCISHSKNCFGWNPGAFWSAVGKLIKQHVNVNKAKETSSSCHCCG